MTSTQNKGAKVSYSETEAARQLGLSVEQLRMLVRNHVAVDVDLPENATFQPSDLIMLRILAGRMQNPAVN